MSILERIITVNGYDSLEHFIRSSFHTQSTAPVVALTTTLTGFAYFVENFLGLNLPIFWVLIALFTLELITGIKASYKEGYGWSTEKFQKGWIKLFVYFIMMAITYTLAVHGPVRPYFGIEFNHFVWINYIFTNYIFVNLLLSNLENFIRLGWKDRFGIVTKVGEMFNLHVLRIKKEKDEREVSE